MSPLERLFDALLNDNRTALLLVGILVVWIISNYRRRGRRKSD